MDSPVTVFMYTAQATRRTYTFPGFFPLPPRPVPNTHAVRNRIARYTANPMDMRTAQDVLEMRAAYERLPAAWLLHTRPCMLTCLDTLRHWDMATIIHALSPQYDGAILPSAQPNGPHFVALRAVADEWTASVLRYHNAMLLHETAMVGYHLPINLARPLRTMIAQYLLSDIPFSLDQYTRFVFHAAVVTHAPDPIAPPIIPPANPFAAFSIALPALLPTLWSYPYALDLPNNALNNIYYYTDEPQDSDQPQE